MEMDPGKLFIGGISWDTNEEQLKEYFQTFGEVIEAVIMKDRTTGRARGFGFVVFMDPIVAERVVKEKHIIDGRTVEAKKAVPRDDQQNINRMNTNSPIHFSPSTTRTKKIFVGGLASTVTENDFKNYFDQFGTTTDVVVMYDHNTQRPRGFGFITYDSEESVEKVLLRTFHELNGKMVEVKRAVPKESSPVPNRTNVNGYNYGLSNRVNGYINGYGYNPSSIGGYGIRVDGRFSPVSVSRTGYSPFGPSSYNIGPNSDPVLGNFSSNFGYGRAPNRFVGPIGYNGDGNGNGNGSSSVLSSMNHEIWGNGNQSYTTNNSSNSSNFMGQGNGFGNFGAIWGNSNSVEGGNGGGGGGGVNAIGYGRNGGNSIGQVSSYGATVDDGDIGGGSFYTDSSWRSPSPDLEVEGLFNYGFGSGASDGIQKKSVGYVGYSVANRSNRGIAA